jgi:energy-converting hydrogenase A subunit R
VSIAPAWCISRWTEHKQTDIANCRHAISKQRLSGLKGHLASVARAFTAAFDLEGPLSPQDNAYEVMHLIKDGPSLFEVLSRYDDYLALQNTPDYEPGDTLKLIVPFLLVNGITERDIVKVSKRAKLVRGAKELIKWLQEDGWNVHVISTSYEQHAYNIASQLGVERTKVHCTRFPLDSFYELLDETETELITEIQNEILSFCSYDGYDNFCMEKLAAELNQFFFEKIPNTRINEIFEKVSVVGGRRKVEALMSVIGSAHARQTAAIGDSITDYKMLQRISSAGGLSVAFNGNMYSLPHANIGIACVDIRPLYLILTKFRAGGVNSAFDIVTLWEDQFSEFLRDPRLIPKHATTPELARFFAIAPDNTVFPRLNVLTSKTDEQLQQIAAVHAKFRSLVRGQDTALLG